MELINKADAINAMDELEQEDIEAYGCSIPECFDGERARLAICLLPTIKAVPIDVLQKMREEIAQEKVGHPLSADEHMGINIAIKIVDKHIKEYTV